MTERKEKHGYKNDWYSLLTSYASYKSLLVNSLNDFFS